jgi:N-methylhydantoinase B
MFEMAVPVLMERKELVADSGGAGRFRGGLGQRAVLRNLGKSPMRVYLASERVRHPCFGVVGGESGTPGKVLKNGEPHPSKGKAVLETGDRLQVETPGGGGWGKANDRSIALIEQDIAEGLITPEAARQRYGYV